MKYFLRTFILVVILNLHFGNNVSAQVASSFANECCTQLNGKYFKSYLTDSRDIIVSPYYWNGNDWLTFGSITAVGAVLYWQDENIQKW